jgi:hypothetical protein
MYAYESVRGNAAVRKRQHFASHEKWNRKVALLLVGKEGFEIISDNLIQRAILGVARSVNAFGAIYAAFSFADHAGIAEVTRRFFIVIRKISLSVSHTCLSERPENEPFYISNDRKAILGRIFFTAGTFFSSYFLQKIFTHRVKRLVGIIGDLRKPQTLRYASRNAHLPL